MSKEQVLESFQIQIEQALDETGKSLRESSAALSLYISERADKLAAIRYDPGFNEAVQAEIANVALKAGILAANQAAATDQRIWGIIAGFLRAGAVLFSAV